MRLGSVMQDLTAMRAAGFETGWFGKPGTGKWTKTHIVRRGDPVCGYTPAAGYLLQTCEEGGSIAVECQKCVVRARALMGVEIDCSVQGKQLASRVQSRIEISGKWLAEAGFTQGVRLTVRLFAGKILISKKKGGE